MISIYTDGACKGNPGTGGWGFVITDEKTGKQRHCWGHVPYTTNSKMEMLAVIKALKQLTKRAPANVTVYSDSNFIIQGVNEWLDGWKARGWRKSNKKPVENVDLWTQIDALNELHDVSWVHVRSHCGIKGNELADSLANRGASGEAGSKTFPLCSLESSKHA